MFVCAFVCVRVSVFLGVIDVTVGCITVEVQNNSEAKLCLNWRSIIQAMVHLM